MLGVVSSCFVRLLAFVAPTPDRVAEPGARYVDPGTGATQLPVSATDNAVETCGVAMITAGPKFPALMKRQGNSFVGYITSGTGCKLSC
jgi:hypothetical protein